MANVALDIRANTAKALGEFKKLSRELDNKFLVQGLKLDVVKNAFRSINREFQQSLGQEGFDTAGTIAQIANNAAANQVIFKNQSEAIARETRSLNKETLLDLQKNATITGEVLKKTLNISSFFDTRGNQEELTRLVRDTAIFNQKTEDIFGKDASDLQSKIITGKLSLDQAQQVDVGEGSAATNLFIASLRERFPNFDSLDPAARTAAVRGVIDELNDTSTKYGALLAELLKDVEIENPFRQIERDIKSIFSPKGPLGVLKEIGGKFENSIGQTVPRNVVQVTAELLRALFSKKDGLFAVLADTLGEAFGFETKEILAPVLNGIELLTNLIRSLTEFFKSPTFKRFLTVFDPLVSALDGVNFKEGISAAEINVFIDGLFEGIRKFLGNISEYIKGIDTSSFESIAGRFIGQIVETIPDILKLVFTSITKLIDVLIGTLNSKGVEESDTGGVFKEVLDGITSIIGKTFELVIAAIPKILSTAIDGVSQAGIGGKVLVGAIVANFLKKVLTGKGFLESVGDSIKATQNRFREGSGANQSNLSAARNSEVSRWNRLYTYLENIIRALNGQAPLSENVQAPLSGEEIGRGERGREKRGTKERNKRARELRAQRRRDRSPGRLSGVRSRFTGFTSNIAQRLRPGRTQYTSPIGPLPVNSVEPWARRGRLDPISSRGGTLYSPRLESAVRPDRFTQAGDAVTRFARGGIGNPGNALNRGLIGTQDPRVASRFASRYGTRGILARGANRAAGAAGGIASAAFGALLIGSIFSGGAAQAREIDQDKTLTPEDKEFYKKQNQKDTRTEAGRQIVGLAGAGIGGAIGTALGGPAGAIIGATLGQLVGDIISDVLPKPILEGIGKLAEDIAKWFVGLWKKTVSVFSKVVKAVGDFFGPDGGLAQLGDFFYELPGKILGKLGEIATTILDSLRKFANGFVIGTLRAFRLNELADKLEGKEDEESSPNFSGGFQMLGGRTSFNEYEALNMPDGVTFVPLTASNTLDRFTGRGRQSTTNNLQITVNVNGITEPQAVATAVIEEIERQYETANV